MALHTFPSGSRWQSQATFLADDNGGVDVARQAPVSGTYEGVSPMGLFWSAERLPGKLQLAAGGGVIQPIPRSSGSRSATVARAELTIERRVAAPGVTRHPLDFAGRCRYAVPPAGRRAASCGYRCSVAVVAALTSIEARSWHRTAMPLLFCLGYFWPTGLPRGLVQHPSRVFRGLQFCWMRAQSWLRDHFLAVWGESRGGELALLLRLQFSRDQCCRRLGS